jgi:glycine cleavage system H lipoate-binding protein
MTDIFGFEYRPELYYNNEHVWLKVEGDGTVKNWNDDIGLRHHTSFFS